MSYKLLTCDTSIGPRVGVLIGDRVYSAEKLSSNPAYQSMLGILEAWDAADAFFAGQAESGRPGARQPLSDARILLPHPYPGDIWRSGATSTHTISELGGRKAQTVNPQ